MDYRKLGEDDVGFYDQAFFNASGGRKARPVEIVDGNMVLDSRLHAERRRQIRALTAHGTPGYPPSRTNDLRAHRTREH